MLAKIGTCDRATDVIKSVNDLVAIRWVALVWSNVREEKSRSVSERLVCLAKIWQLLLAMSWIHSQQLITNLRPLQGLIDKTMSGHESSTLEEYVNGDTDLLVGVDKDGDDWEETFLTHLAQEMRIL